MSKIRYVCTTRTDALGQGLVMQSIVRRFSDHGTILDIVIYLKQKLLLVGTTSTNDTIDSIDIFAIYNVTVVITAGDIAFRNGL